MPRFTALSIFSTRKYPGKSGEKIEKSVKVLKSPFANWFCLFKSIKRGKFFAYPLVLHSACSKYSMRALFPLR
jgi:hypothetical protein